MLVPQFQSLIVGVVINAGHQADLGAIALGCLHLGDGRRVRQADQRRNTALGGGQSHALGMVAGGTGDHAVLFFLFTQHGDLIAGAAKLKRTGILQIFRL